MKMKGYIQTTWWTSFLIIGAFAFGLLFALGHHLFYQSLDGNPTSDSEQHGTQHLGQQINIAIGTLFAFLAKAAFILSITTTYYQVFWRAVKKNTQSGHAPTLSWLDSAFSATSSITSLLPLPTWLRYPVLLFIAISTWLIPIASIITPATLSVALRENIANITSQFVPLIDFDNLNFVAGMPAFDGVNSLSPYYVYNGPSQIIQQIATAVAAQDSILAIKPPHPNSTWNIEFYGPALECEVLQSNTSFRAEHNASDQNHRFLQNMARHVRENCDAPPTFLAWFPRILDVEKGAPYDAPYFQGQNTSSMWCDDPYSLVLDDPTWCGASYAQGTMNETLSTYNTWWDTDYNSTWMDPNSIFKYGITYDRQIRQNASLYFAVLPSLMTTMEYTLTTEAYACFDTATGTGSTPSSPLGVLNDNITMLHCKMRNSTYKADFYYINGEQSVALNVTHHEDVPIINVVRGPGPSGSGLSDNCTTLNSYMSEDKVWDPCNFEYGLLSQLSYQAVLQAFSELVTGNITLNNITLGPLDSSRIRSTALIDTKELRYLSDYELHQSSPDSRLDLQKALRNASLSAAPSIAHLNGATKDRSLGDAIEQMFQNITLSLMTSAALQPNHSSPSAPPKTVVTIFTAQTVYAYSAQRLWAAYACAALVTLICVVTGIFTIFANGASYSSSFSTVFRFAKGTELSVEIKPEDLDGKSPLPEYLEKSQLQNTGHVEVHIDRQKYQSVSQALSD
ncbi:hypothetical protein yc1106_00033 [Curvularia clavata]|uniref:Uncharacterized protein n=1 Tax=Curvularia clavata TaxID=95742 RepID=A0A9Q9DNP2_CURCL|nr:hypothetical protein yc1106_00033 [Curvularia clavata]